MLEDVIEQHEYVAVLFTGLCADDEDKEECTKVVESLEKIDTNLDEYGIVFVMSSQLDKARQLWIGRFPALAFFRNGEYVKYSGDLKKAKTVFKWLTASKQIFVPDKIDERLTVVQDGAAWEVLVRILLQRWWHLRAANLENFGGTRQSGLLLFL